MKPLCQSGPAWRFALKAKLHLQTSHGPSLAIARTREIKLLGGRLLKKITPAVFPVASRSLAKVRQMTVYNCIASIILTGCAALDTHQARLDQKQLREGLMDYTEDQILDNLIRAYNGRAIVHFDVKTVTATVASKVAPNVGYGRTLTSNRLPGNATQTTTTTGPTNNLISTAVQTTVGAVSAVVGTITEPFTSSLAAERTNNVLVDVKPQDERKIYAAYIKFLNTGSEGSASEKENANKSANTASEEKGKDKQELETSKVTTTITTVKEPADATTETTPPATATATPSLAAGKAENPRKEVKETTSTKTEAVPKKEKDTGADLIVKAHPMPPRPTDNMQPLMQTRTKPCPEKVLVGPKRWNGDYYWIPMEYRKSFFELCVATVTKGASTSSASEAAQIKAQETNQAVREELEDINSLQRLKLGTPP